MSLRSALAIAKKDVIDAVRSLRILSVVLLPIAMSIVFGALFSGIQSDAAELVVHDPGHSCLASLLSDSSGFRIYPVDAADQVSAEVLRRNALGGLAIPADLDSEIALGQQPTVHAYANARFPQAGQRLQELIEEHARTLAGQQPPARFQYTVLEPKITRAELDLKYYILSLFLGMSLSLTGVMVPAMLLAEEKEKRTIRPLLTAPVSEADLVTGKGLAGLTYVLIGAGVVLVANGGLHGNLFALGVTVVASALFVVQVGLLLGSLFSDVSSLNTWSSVVILPLLLPAMLIPLASNDAFNLSWIVAILRFVPTYYSAHALDLALSGGNVLRIAPDLLVLLACALAASILTVRAVRTRR